MFCSMTRPAGYDLPMTLKLVSSMATRELLGELMVQWRRSGGADVNMEAAGGVDVEKRIQAGEAADVVVLSRNALDRLAAGGWLLADSCVDLVRSGIAVAVRAGAPRPPILDESAVREAVLGARTLSYSTGPSGVYLEKLFERWGILQQLRPRIVVPPPGKPVGSLVADGQAELGFQQLSELMNLPGIAVLGPLPASIQHVTVFSGAIARTSAQVSAARRLLDFMTAPAVDGIKQRCGMDLVNT